MKIPTEFREQFDGISWNTRNYYCPLTTGKIEKLKYRIWAKFWQNSHGLNSVTLMTEFHSTEFLVPQISEPRNSTEIEFRGKISMEFRSAEFLYTLLVQFTFNTKIRVHTDGKNARSTKWMDLGPKTSNISDPLNGWIHGSKDKKKSRSTKWMDLGQKTRKSTDLLNGWIQV